MRKMILCKSDVLLVDEDSDASTWIDVEVNMDAHYISLFVFICLYVCLCVRESGAPSASHAFSFIALLYSFSSSA